MPRAPNDAHLLFARHHYQGNHDRYFGDLEEVRAAYEELTREGGLWEGADVRWVAEGHVSAILLARHKMVPLILEVLEKVRRTETPALRYTTLESALRDLVQDDSKRPA